MSARLGFEPCVAYPHGLKRSTTRCRASSVAAASFSARDTLHSSSGRAVMEVGSPHRLPVDLLGLGLGLGSGLGLGLGSGLGFGLELRDGPKHGVAEVDAARIEEKHDALPRLVRVRVVQLPRLVRGGRQLLTLTLTSPYLVRG